MNYLIVFIGAGIGGAGRHGVNVLSARLFSNGFPLGTLTVNVVGCMVMGLLAGFFAFRGHLPQEWRLLLTTGVLGGFTTFSAFALDATLMWERGNFGLAFIYVLASVALSLGALVAGLYLARVAWVSLP